MAGVPSCSEAAGGVAGGRGTTVVDRAVIEAVTRRGGPQDGGYRSRVTLGSLISHGEAPVSRERLGAARSRNMKTGAGSCLEYVLEAMQSEEDTNP